MQRWNRNRLASPYILHAKFLVFTNTAVLFTQTCKNLLPTHLSSPECLRDLYRLLGWILANLEQKSKDYLWKPYFRDWLPTSEEIGCNEHRGAGVNSAVLVRSCVCWPESNSSYDRGFATKDWQSTVDSASGSPGMASCPFGAHFDPSLPDGKIFFLDFLLK